ncbi:YfdQ family protein [Vibrio harveyi]|uniref:DUF2303 family protein n=1 Tax=Vibrio harveyi TaxID=669 RepID=UPI003BB65C3F
MSLTKEAIQELVQNGHVPDFLKNLENADVQSQLILVPDNCSLKDLESHQEFRNNLRGTFKTTLIPDFVSYVADNNGEGAQTFVEAKEMSAETIFDIGTKEKAGHQRHRARVALVQTAPYKSLLRLDGSKLDQRAMAEHLEDWSEFFQAFDGDGNVIEMHKAAAAIRDLDFTHTRGSTSSVGDFAQRQSQYEEMATKTKEDLVLPAVFKFTCVPYNSLKEHCFELRLSVIRNETLILRIKRLEEEQEKIAQEFLESVKEQLTAAKVEMPIYIGEF